MLTAICIRVKSEAQKQIVTCSIDMRFKGQKLGQAVQLLVSAVGCTEAKAGCRECRVVRDATEGDRVRYSEQWDSEPAFHRHLKSDEFHRVLVAMELSCEEPKVVVGNLIGHRGIAHLQEMREMKNESAV
jgi:quinol monooxygenase YgiN